MDFSKLLVHVKAYSLKNALEFGKVDPSKIVSKLFQHGLEKSDVGQIMPEIIKEAKRINSLKKEQVEKEYLEFSEYVKEKKEEEKGLAELPNVVQGKCVFRIAPFPSGALHIGNAKTFALNYLYSKKYEGKLILVIDDTIGSEAKQIEKDSYGLIEEALKWLGVKYDNKIIYKSDRLEIYYEYAQKLIKLEKAYVCKCSKEEFRELKEKGKECSCRQFDFKEQNKRWKEIFEAKEGSCVLRIKTSMQHPNPAFRDRVLFKISDREHPRVGKKYRVWPSLEMSWAVDDHLLGITHIIRGNELVIESDMEKYIWDIFGWKYPEIIHTGLVNISGIEGKISKSKAQKEVKSGEFIGWDDPRTWSIQSLARRGMKPEAVINFIEEIGLNKQNIDIPVDSLYSINRKLIDFDSDRYYFIENPVELKIENAPDIKEVEIQIHPEKDKKRKLKIGRIFVSGKDYEDFLGKEVRLLHLFNIKLNKNGLAVFTSLENKNIKKIQWVSDFSECKVFMPNGAFVEGYADSGIKNIKVGDVVQFERFGFCRLDKKDKKGYEFWFAHM